MNLRIGKIRRYNNKILIASPSFKIGTNLKVNLDGAQAKLKDKPDVKLNEERKQDTKRDIEINEGHKQDVKLNIEFHGESKPDTNNFTYEEEKVALILGITSIFTVWWIFK